MFDAIIIVKEFDYNKELLQRMVKSINEFGLICSISIDKDNNLIDGGLRLKACSIIGIKSVRVIKYKFSYKEAV